MDEIAQQNQKHWNALVQNRLIAQCFTILGLWEDDGGRPDAEPGSWDHFIAVAPPLLKLWAWRE